MMLELARFLDLRWVSFVPGDARFGSDPSKSSLDRVFAVLMLVLGGWLCGCSAEPPPVTPPPSGADVDPFVLEYARPFVAAARRTPDDPAVRGRLGAIYAANSLDPLAHAEFRAAATVDPSDPVWVLHAISSSESFTDAATIRGQFESLCTEFPEFAPGWHRLAEARLEDGDIRGALEAVEVCLELAPDAAPVIFTKARARIREGEPRLALQLLQPVLAANPEDRTASFLFGTARARAGFDDPETRRLLEENRNPPLRFLPTKVDRDPSVRRVDYVARVNAARDCALDGRYAEAIELLEPCIAHDPDDANALNNLADAYYGVGRLDDALGTSARALELQPSNHRVLSNRAVFLLTKAQRLAADGNRNGAERALFEAVTSGERAVAIDPEDWRPRGRLARAYLVAGRLDDARRECEAAHRMAPDRATPLRVLSEVARQQGDTERTVAALEALRVIDPNDLRVRMNLTSAYLDAGRIELARQTFDALRAAEPDFDLGALERALRARERLD